MHDTFLSYRRKDATFARLIKAELERMGHSPFMDADDIGHKHFDEAILRAIQEAKHFVLIVTADALHRCSSKRDWVRLEIEAALRWNKNIVLIRAEDSGDIARANLPLSIENIKTINAITFSNEYYKGFYERLKEALGDTPAANSMAEHLAARTEPPSRQREQESGYQARPALRRDIPQLLEFLDHYFEDNAEPEQIVEWINVYPSCFTLIEEVQSKTLVGTYKVLPLNEGACDFVEKELITGTSIQAENMVSSLAEASGIWFGDLAVDGNKFQRGVILGEHIVPLLIGDEFSGTVYARASKKEGYDLLIRYRFELINPALRDAQKQNPSNWKPFLNRVMRKRFS